jgi:hypothetical protein
MANLTLTIDDDVLRRARIKALEEGTSVNAIVRRQIEDYVAGPTPAVALEGFLERARRSTASSGPGGRTWTREDLYADRLRRR